MKPIQRPLYLRRLIDRRHNGMAKVVTGLRRCGKSYLLFRLYKEWLLSQGVDEKHIIRFNLEDIRNRALRDPMALYERVSGLICDDRMHYLMLDEVQMVTDFVDVLNGFLNIDNVDVYVTGSNAKYLSKDVITEFRGRGDEVRIRPLSFMEYMSAYDGTKTRGFDDYMRYGGLPQVLQWTTDEQKTAFLTNLFIETYIRDIKERHRLRTDIEMDDLVDIIASSIGSLTNLTNITNTFKSHYKSSLSVDTIKKYLEHLSDVFVIERAKRYDVKGRRFVDAQYKYYMTDMGLRNARLGFSLNDPGHMMENVIYNELRIRGFSVDVGVVPVQRTEADGKRRRAQLEVDFVATLGNRRYYIQSAFKMLDQDKISQELASLQSIPDSHKKIVIVGDDIAVNRYADGIVLMGIYDFLLNPDSLNF